MSALWPPHVPPGRRVEVLAERLAPLVGPSVEPVVRGEWARFFTRARYAQEALTLAVTDPVGTFRLMVPDRPDVALDRLAEVVNQVSRLRSRFPWAAVRLVSLDDPSALKPDRPHVVGFVADPQLLEIHASRGYVLAPAGDAAPEATAEELAEVVVHECWHLIEEVFETLSYGDSMRLRMELGGLLGLASFEHAYAGSHASRDQKAAALESLREAVGDYATTLPGEGTAELFTAWWLGRSHPLVSAFGDLVDRYLPPDLGRRHRLRGRRAGPSRRP
ncbi:MAG TPA: hypothetical protein VHE80_10890 [Acidimicrobiales bacterium]|nr:hypothetical protein [Acidimicrobiales bacterium]